MAAFKPEKLILRCYGYQFGKKPFIGVCIDLNLAVQADSEIELKIKMKDAIISYLETVLDTDDKQSIPSLLFRRAPIQDFIIYYALKLLFKIRQIPTKFIFKEYIPFHLAHNR